MRAYISKRQMKIDADTQRKNASAHREVFLDCAEQGDDVIDIFMGWMERDRIATHTGAVSGAVLTEAA